MKKIKEKILAIITFLNEGIWKIRISELPTYKVIFIRVLRVILLAVRGFQDDKVGLRASALTFYSLLSIVPVLAMAFGISKGFGLEKLLENELRKNFVGQQEVLDQSLSFAHTFLENTKGGTIAGVGLVLLFYTIMKLLNNIETSFNNIWGQKSERTFVRKFTDYLSIMLIAPILLILAGSLTVYITTTIIDITQGVKVLEYLTPFLIFLLKFLPYVIMWLLFTFIYIIMPNTKVNFKSAFVAGIVAGTIYQLTQWGYINFQVGVSRYNAIYGSFAALPLFLIWLQLSWHIILFGAEVSFAVQNVNKYEYEINPEEASFHTRKYATLLIMNVIVKQFMQAKPALTIVELSDKLEIPTHFVRRLVDDLIECKIINEINSTTGNEATFQPAFDINKISIKSIIDVLENKGNSIILRKEVEGAEIFTQALEEFSKIIETSPKNSLFKDI